jgi:hypothetical protein
VARCWPSRCVAGHGEALAGQVKDAEMRESERCGCWSGGSTGPSTVLRGDGLNPVEL